MNQRFRSGSELPAAFSIAEIEPPGPNLRMISRNFDFDALRATIAHKNLRFAPPGCLIGTKFAHNLLETLPKLYSFFVKIICVALNGRFSTLSENLS